MKQKYSDKLKVIMFKNKFNKDLTWLKFVNKLILNEVKDIRKGK